MPVFASAPTIFQETLIFPYLTGAEFMRRFKQEAKGRVAVHADADVHRAVAASRAVLHDEG